ncbi:hypothetical protein SLEP1_g47885 [Rubroshorea leprosula]|uniref:Uncharacterized protein n=2 Tax=Rubroshorea leprosula TaxID=152421 RepID=A0AAV5LSV5_9ROSI|nr:hypothetical protein SLEP1_g47885 [Rubroshorea leprosula]
MARICCPDPAVSRNWMAHQSPFIPQKAHGARCCSAAPGNGNGSKTPQLLKLAVSGVTELLRPFSFSEARYPSLSSVWMAAQLNHSGADLVVGGCLLEWFLFCKQLYSRNLKLLLPFFESPSIGLQTIEKGVNLETNFVLAKWRLRTYLKLPWRPLISISIDGSTFYELDDKFMIARHTERWNVSALEAVGQIFTLSFRSPND